MQTPVIFALEDTLISTSATFQAAAHAIAAELEAVLNVPARTAYAALRAIEAKAIETGGADARFRRRFATSALALYRRFADEAGAAYELPVEAKLAVIASEAACGPFPAIEAAAEVVREVAGRGYPVGISALGDPEIDRGMIRELGLHEIAEATHASVRKGPDELRLLTCLVTGSDEPPPAVVFGPSASHDVVPAAELGNAGVLVTWGIPEDGRWPYVRGAGALIDAPSLADPAEVLTYLADHAD